MVAPKARTPLSADALVPVVRRGCAPSPEPRAEAVDLACTATLLAACALFSLHAPSLPAFDKERTEGHGHTLDGLQPVPGDPSRRERLEPVSPTVLRPVCQSVVRQRQRGKALDARPCLDGPALVALDGPGSGSAQTLHGASCLPQGHRHGTRTSTPQRLGAALRHPDVRAVLPVRPDPLVPQDGTAKQAGERHAAHRFLPKVRLAHPPRRCIVTAERLRAKAPPRETRPASGLRAMLGGKEGAQAWVGEQGPAAEQAGHVTPAARHDRAAGVPQRLRWVHARPLQASQPTVRVHGLAYGARGPHKGQHVRWVTDLPGRKRNGVHRRRGGRARGQRAHATCQTLHNQGDTFAPTSGPGEQPLAVVWAVRRRLACCVDQAQQRCWAWWQAVWAKLGSKRLRWERRRALCYPDHLHALRTFCAARFDGFEPSRPLVSLDASSTPLLPGWVSWGPRWARSGTGSVSPEHERQGLRHELPCPLSRSYRRQIPPREMQTVYRSFQWYRGERLQDYERELLTRLYGRATYVIPSPLAPCYPTAGRSCLGLSCLQASCRLGSRHPLLLVRCLHRVRGHACARLTTFTITGLSTASEVGEVAVSSAARPHARRPKPSRAP